MKWEEREEEEEEEVVVSDCLEVKSEERKWRLIQRRMLDLENGWKGSILMHQDGSLHEWEAGRQAVC